MLTEHIELPDVPFSSWIVIRRTPNPKWRSRWQVILWNNNTVLGLFETEDEALEACEELRTRVMVAQALADAD